MGAKDEERRLTSILSLDVVEFSRLMSIDEVGTLLALKNHRKELIDPKTSQYGGRLIKLMGDGALIEFGSVVDAVRFAADVQRTMQKRNSGVPKDRQIRLRIGVNIGDILVEGDDIYGDGVNIASRLEQLADIGGICISDSAYQQVRNKLDLPFEALAPQRVKNIAEPIKAWRVALDGVMPTKAGQRRRRVIPALALAAVLVAGFTVFLVWNEVPGDGTTVITDEILREPSGPKIGVLPFESLTDNRDDILFAAGITEDIIAALTRFQELHVIAQITGDPSLAHDDTTSGSALAGTDSPSLPDIQGLALSYTLTGTIRRSPDTIRITARLHAAVDGRQVWAGTYDRPLVPAEILSVQQEVASKIVSAIASTGGGTITAGKLRGSLGKAPHQLSSYECVIAAMAYVHYDPSLYTIARDCLIETVKAEPEYADAWAMLAEIYGAQWYGYEPLIPGETYDPLKRALEAAKRSVMLAPDNARAHYALAISLDMAGDLPGFYAEARRALELNPNEPVYLGSLGNWIAFTGRWEEGLALIEKAARLNPGSFAPWWHYAPAMQALRHGDHETAIRRFQQSFTGWWVNYMHQAYTYGLMGDEVKAGRALDSLFQLQPNFDLEKALIFHQKYQFDPSFIDLVLEGLRRAGVPPAA